MGHYLVVGGAGYVGSHAVLALKEAGQRVLVYDNLSTGHRELLGDTPLVTGDIADADALDAVFSQGPFDAILHFAAKIEVGQSVQDPLLYYRNNVGGMITLLSRAVAAKVPAVVFSSTAAVYGTPAAMPLTEDLPKAPINPYGRTKAVMEDLLADCHRAYGLNWVALRYFNAAGADPKGRSGEWHRPESHLIPNILMAAMGRREALSIFGDDYPTPDGTCVRDYIHVSDLGAAHVAALDLAARGLCGPYNLGTGRGYSVKEVFDAVRRELRRDIPFTVEPRRPGDPPELVADVGKFTAATRWRPRYADIGAIVAHAAAWHRDHGFGIDR